MGQKGKWAGGPQGVSPLRGSGAAPRTPYRASSARGIRESWPAFQAASASTKFGNSSNIRLFFNVR
jgi:hypothetical protein